MLTVLTTQNATAVTTTDGAQIASFRIGEREYIWPGTPEIWADHTPILFPIIGGLNDGKTNIEGRPYEIRKHGFARYSIFELVYASDTAVEYRLCTSEETYRSYPFDFMLTVKHRIFGNGFETVYTVKNNDVRPMPYCIGGHPGIMLGNYADWTVVFDMEEDTQLYNVSKDGIFSEKLKAEKIVGKSLALNIPGLFDNGALIARDIRSKRIVFEKNDKSEAIGLEYEDFDLLALWTPVNKNAPFVCAEPWCGMSPNDDETGNMEDKPFVKVLGPGESRSFAYIMNILK